MAHCGRLTWYFSERTQRSSPVILINNLPSISVVTPSFNQAAFLEDAMVSVLRQGYEKLEYVVIDGGSTDHSVTIIQRHASSLRYWVSEADGGQYDAIAKGFQRTSGEVMAWLNSDDRYTEWAFSIVGEIFARFPEVEWITTLYPIWWDLSGRAVRCEALQGFSKSSFRSGEHLPITGYPHLGFIQQESTFWRRSLWERSGGLSTACGAAGDFDLWARFFAAGAELISVATPIGGFRIHPDQKTSRAYDAYLSEAEEILKSHGGRRPSRTRQILRALAQRAPAAAQYSLARFGLMHACRICRYDRARNDWVLTGKLI